MAVVWVREKFGNEAERDRDNGRYRRKYLIKISDPVNDRELNIINDSLVQDKLRFWEAGGIIDHTVSLSRFRLSSLEEHPYLYELEVEFEGITGSDDVGGGGGTGPDNPFDEAPEFEYSWASRRRTKDFAYSVEVGSPGQGVIVRGVGKANSAFEPFENQPDVEDDDLVLTFARNEPRYNVEAAIAYANSVNVDAISGARPGQLLMKPWRATLEVRNGIPYWRVRYTIQMRKDGWVTRLLNYGSYYWPGGTLAPTATRTYFKDKDGHPIHGFLADNGDKLPDGSAPTYIEFLDYQLMNFGALNLPLPELPDRNEYLPFTIQGPGQ